METDGKIWLIVVKTCRDNTAAQERKHHRHIQKPTNCNITMPQGKIRCFGFTTKFAQMFHSIHFLSFVSRICNTMNFACPANHKLHSSAASGRRHLARQTLSFSSQQRLHQHVHTRLKCDNKQTENSDVLFQNRTLLRKFLKAAKC